MSVVLLYGQVNKKHFVLLYIISGNLIREHEYHCPVFNTMNDSDKLK